MINQIIFEKIKFDNLDYKKFEKLIVRKGLFVFPSGQPWLLLKSRLIIINPYKNQTLFF